MSPTGRCRKRSSLLGYTTLLMLRQRSGSVLCYACGKLNRADASVCFYCGARWPGLWGRQLAPPVEALFGRARLVVIFTVGGVMGFVVSNLAGVLFTIGASGAVFGLLGAMVQYGRSRGGAFGMAVFRQYGQWALVIFVLGFLMPVVNNLAHAGGFAGGYLAALLAGHGERSPERSLHRLAALAVLALTSVGFGQALWTAVVR